MNIDLSLIHILSIFEREPETIPEVDFYVAECSEFPTLGEYYDGLTLDEAIALYEKIPGERLNGVKGIGIDLHLSLIHIFYTGTRYRSQQGNKKDV